MNWFIYFLTDVSNVVLTVLPLVCYLGAVWAAVRCVSTMPNLGHPGKRQRGDGAKCLGWALLSSLLIGFVQFFNAGNGTLGLGGRIATGGDPFPLDAPEEGTFMGATPGQIFLAALQIAEPAFYASGLLAAVRGLFVINDISRDGVGTFRLIVFELCGVILFNFYTIADNIMAAGAALVG
jgi:hypothetical protein